MEKVRASDLGLDIPEVERMLDKFRGLPLHTYYDPKVYEFELGAIFDRSWQYVCPLEKLTHPGNVVVDQIGRTPVVITRGQDGELHGLVNSCRHRGYRVAREGAERAKLLRCFYHSWSYDLAGKLVRAPGAEEEPDFDPADHCLIPVQVDTWAQAVFVNPDLDAPPLRTAFSRLDEWTDSFGFETDLDRYILHSHHETEIEGNWKLWWDNGTECYHCPTVHGDSFNQVYLTAPGEHSFDTDENMLTATFSPRVEADSRLSAGNYRSMHLMPGFQTVQQSDFMLLSKMTPTGPESCRFIIDYLAEEGADPARVEKWIKIWQETYMEDIGVIGVQQKNMRIPSAQPFRYVSQREGPSIHVLRQHWNTMKAYLVEDSASSNQTIQ